MKTKGKEEEKKGEKKGKEAKRKRLCPESNSGPPTHQTKALPLGHPRGTHTMVGRNFIFLLLKPSSLVKREFKRYFSEE